MKNFACVVLLAGLLCSPTSRGLAQTVKLEGDVWAPYVMDPGSGSKGFMVDIAELVFKRAGYSVSYEAIPWTRALKDTESGKVDGIVGIYFRQAKDKAFVVPAEEIGISVNHLFVKVDSTWTYAGADSLKNMVLGTIADYDYGELSPYIREQLRTKSGKVQEIHSNDALKSNLLKLLTGRLTVVIEDAIVVNYVASSLDMGGKIKSAGAIAPRNKVGIAFSPKNPRSPEYAKILSEGLAKIRKSGELKAILDKYYVQDWKK